MYSDELNIDLQKRLKEDFKFIEPSLAAAKWEHYQEIESCIENNLKDPSDENKENTLHLISLIFVYYKKNIMKRDPSDSETIDCCDFLIRKIE